MKKKYWLTMLLLAVFLMPFSAVTSHPGRTDANGGHWDRSNGTYHFHSGESAGKSSSDSSAQSEYTPFTPPYDPPTDNPYKNDKNVKAVSNTDSGIKEVLENILTVGICIWCIVMLVFLDFEKSDGCLTFGISTILIVCLIGHMVEERTELFFGLILIAAIFIPVVLKLKKKYTVTIANIDLYINSFHQLSKYSKNLSQIETQIEKCENVYIPDLYEIGKDNLPRDKNSVSYWGKSFTLYKTDKGTKLHTKYNCCFATKPLHIYHCRNYRDFSKLLCKKCADDYVMPDISWYENSLKYEQAVSMRQSIENSCDKLQKEIKDLHKKCNSLKTKILIIFSEKNKKALQEANNKYQETQTVRRGNPGEQETV